jgi:succinoglycan biosynthesis transport protein ExoP
VTDLFERLPDVPRPRRDPAGPAASRDREPWSVPSAPVYARTGLEPDLLQYVQVLRRRKLTIALVTLVITGIAVAFTFLSTPVYEATATVVLRNTASQDVVTPTGGGSDRSAIQTELEIMQSTAVREEVERRLGRSVDVGFGQRPDTQVVAITARDTDADDAAEAADAYATTYIEIRRDRQVEDYLETTEDIQGRLAATEDELDALTEELDRINSLIVAFPADGNPADLERLISQRDAESESIDTQREALEARLSSYEDLLSRLELSSNIAQGGAQVVSEAAVPSSPAQPRPVQNAAVGLVVGLVLGIVAAFVKEQFDDTFSRKGGLEEVAGGLPTLAIVPEFGTRGRSTVHSLTDPSSSVAEAYRTLRTSVQFSAMDHDVSVIQVTSSVSGEGKTTTAANLAVALARSGHRVVLVDNDLRRPSLHTLFGLDNAVGFTSVLLRDADLAEAVQAVESEPRLSVIASGPRPPDPSVLLSPNFTRGFFEELRARYDYVVIDTPPLLPVADAMVASESADAVVFVVRAGSTTRRQVHRAVELLQRLDILLLGTLLTHTGDDGGYGELYGYGYGYIGYGGSPAEERGGVGGLRGRWRSRTGDSVGSADSRSR